MDVKTNEGFVYMDLRGRYLVVTERHTHTGHHLDVTWTMILNDATLLPAFPGMKLQRLLEDLDPVIKLPARSEITRSVFLQPPTTSN